MNDRKDILPELTDEMFKSMFKDVDPRAAPPPAIEKVVYRTFREDWEKLRASRRRRKITYLAMAASVLLAVLIQPLFFSQTATITLPLTLGVVDKFMGQVAVQDASSEYQLNLQSRSLDLVGGQILTTSANSGLSINWGNGRKSVRADQETELKLLSSTQIELTSGRLYVDVPTKKVSGSTNEALEIVTRFGTVMHTGTQFMVAVDDTELEVQVREGSVAIENGKLLHTAHYGVKGTLDAEGDFTSELFETYGAEWTWAENLAPNFEIEGRTLADFLDQVQRETGKKLAYQSIQAKSIAEDTLLHGSVLELEPMQALGVILQTTELSWSEQDGTIEVYLDPK